MLVCLNGEWVPEAEACVSVFDRGFLYGDALFETMRVTNGRVFRWRDHLARLEASAVLLEMRMPCPFSTLHQCALELIRRNEVAEGILRLTVSRGTGPRGYSPLGADRPSFILSLHPLSAPSGVHPASWKVVTSKWRLPAGAGLHSLKSANRLTQVMARSEAAQAGVDEALMLNHQGILTEGAASNVFWIESNTVLTPGRSTGLLPGITRQLVLECCTRLGLEAIECDTGPDRVHAADGIFCTFSTLGIVEVTDWDHRPCPCSPLTRRLQVAYADLVQREAVTGCE